MTELPGPPVMGPHMCGTCGQLHGGDDDMAAVKIAEINANRDIQVAKIGRGEFQTTPLEAETQIAVAEIQATAGVAETEALADGIAQSGDSEEMPAIMDTPVPDAEPEVQDSIEPREEDDSGPPAEPKSNWSYWG
jgi:hypothetical protein